MGILSVPGNIKQQYLPFVLNPKSKLNHNVEESKELASGAGAQCFSFRRKSYEKEYNAGFALLNICPSSFREADFGNYLAKDISFRTLFSQINKDTGKSDKKSITADDLFDAIPGVQIREYLPDSRLDQAFNLFGDILSTAITAATGVATGVVDMVKWIAKGGLGEFLADPDRVDKLKLSLGYVWDWVTSNPQIWNKNNFLIKDGKWRFSGLQGNDAGVYDTSKAKAMDFADTAILTFPYTIYYKILTSVTTNVYELPYMSNLLYDVKGKLGWGKGEKGVTSKMFSKLGSIGDMLGAMFNNIRIQHVNLWDAASGSRTDQPEVTVKFCLFNDTADRAMFNFIFVNTIAPNNMWVQYGVFQHSSALYDVKLEGYGRFFACMGNVKVETKGVMRLPPPEWIKKLVYTYGNYDDSKGHGRMSLSNLLTAIKNENIIRIPDVYEVTLSFESLLPQNLNTYLYQYSQNMNIERAYANSSLFQESETNRFNIADQLKKDLKAYNDKGVKDDLKKLKEKREKEKSGS